MRRIGREKNQKKNCEGNSEKINRDKKNRERENREREESGKRRNGSEKVSGQSQNSMPYLSKFLRMSPRER